MSRVITLWRPKKMYEKLKGRGDKVDININQIKEKASVVLYQEIKEVAYGKEDRKMFYQQECTLS